MKKDAKLSTQYEICGFIAPDERAFCQGAG